ncbi:hypothetical protein J8M20_22355 [Pseudoalteromonas luteoviolacea]|uniref:Uncharacterized protein n=1 Tax=Pseudoalteromonas luteoviolacea S4060-1 TaxID=1365257 RepID=A0A161Y297_9GAMM|nr:hypothetical protein [Pseudoalteromonas luteoviolacea]KZN60861.1 hypothetical protein N478_25995 [Pseudoalteromonas luteoviolacea S4060-1]MBQ4814125.1 hypothetical protein [Pseudoalteromonas luteoviolacea]
MKGKIIHPVIQQYLPANINKEYIILKEHAYIYIDLFYKARIAKIMHYSMRDAGIFIKYLSNHYQKCDLIELEISRYAKHKSGRFKELEKLTEFANKYRKSSERIHI